MSFSTNPEIIHQLVQLSADLCEENRKRCVQQLIYLYNQRQVLAEQRQKRTERLVAENAELSAVCESMGLESVRWVLARER